MAKLTVNFKNMPKGLLLEVPGYGVFKNGSINDVAKLKEDLVLGSVEDAEPSESVNEFKVEEDPPVNEDPQPASTEPEPTTPGRKTKKKDGE